MDYAEMVSQIMAAEQGAKVLAEESRARRQQLQAGLEDNQGDYTADPAIDDVTAGHGDQGADQGASGNHRIKGGVGP